jgi:hypothetical protein
MDSTRASGDASSPYSDQNPYPERATFDAMAAHCSIRCTAATMVACARPQCMHECMCALIEPIFDPIANPSQSLPLLALVITRAVCDGSSARYSAGHRPESDTLETTLVALRHCAVACICVRSANHRLSSTAVRTELPATCGLHITNLRVHLRLAGHSNK